MVSARVLALGVTALVVAGTSCINDDYECTTDADCNLGTGGRCELDHHCTIYDSNCPVQRRYTWHSGANANECFHGQIDLVDFCADGQPAALGTGCAARVCTALPTCCKTGWSEACVLEAQRDCPIRCDTRIAITASNSTTIETWDLEWDPVQKAWSASQMDVPPYSLGTVLSYLAPAQGESEPRLSGFRGETFVVEDPAGEIDVAIDATRKYENASSVDFDRDLRDTVALGYQDQQGLYGTEIIKLADATGRDVANLNTTSARTAWGDWAQRGYPDAVSAAAGKYALCTNDDDGTDQHERQLDQASTTTFFGTSTKIGAPTAPASRSFEWGDIDGDLQLDVVGFGNAIEVRRRSDPSFDTMPPFLRVDCYDANGPLIDPTTALCDNTTGQPTPPTSADSSVVNFAGALLPTTNGTEILASLITNPAVNPGPPPSARQLYLIDPNLNDPAMSSRTELTLPCVGCASILAVVVRDLDYDQVLDVIAIDAQLKLLVWLSRDHPGAPAPIAGTMFTPFSPIATGSTFTTVRTSTSGALR